MAESGEVGASFYFEITPPNAWGANGKVAVMNKKTGKPYVRSKAATVDTKGLLVTLILSQKPRGFKTIEGPVGLKVCVTWPWLPSSADHKKCRKAGMKWVAKITKPDTDNCMKSIKDALETCGIFKNDSQVWVETGEKRHGEDPGISIEVIISRDPRGQIG